jgi:serine/threonine protein kinase/tetratricopeptide (TPR) repeat protein
MRTQTNPAKSIFLEAIEKYTPDQRPAFVEQACAGDRLLRAEVEKLLRAQAEMGSFHEAPRVALTTTLAEPMSECPGSTIGPYTLLEQIGEGGFGVVFLAEQHEPIRRKVALKVLKPGMDTRQVVARFEAERQALALMDHPNIARVVEGSATASGRPYFVMEWVQGVSITDFCDQNHLAPEARLRLFLDVCHAIQHAHHKGVIHRDIKPANVLVTRHDGRPVVKVIDFGIAKATGQPLIEQALRTDPGQMIGTPEYMSPEQAGSGLDFDTRSDVYALGVLLYELLTGTTPLAGKRLQDVGYAELQRLIREEEAPRPSTRLSSLGDSATLLAGNRGLDVKRLAQLLAGDLDWIVMKALEKDRNRRYDSPGSFAEDVERYLRREAVLARPPSLTYKVKKFAQRNRAAVLTAAAVAAALFAGLAVATWQAVSATRAEAEARAAAEAERRARADAEAREAAIQSVLQFVQERVFAAARPEGLPGGLGHEVTLRQALEAALPFLETSFTNEPLIEARLRLTLGTSFASLGDHRTAAEQLATARSLFARHCGPDHPDTLRSLNNLANSTYALGRYADALKLYEEKLELQKISLSADHPDTLTTRNQLASSYHALGRYADALKLHEETLALQKAQLEADHPDTLTTMTNLANDYQALGRYADALKLREETLALQKVRLGPEHPETLRSMSNLAGSYHVLGRHADALQLDRETLALRKGKLGADHPDTLTSMSNLANDYQAVSRHSDALQLNKETLALRKARLGPDHPDTLRSMNNLADSTFVLGRYADALKLYEETLALRKARLGANHPDTLVSMIGLADSYTAVGRHADALTLYKETLALRKARLGPDHPHTLQSLWGVAESLVRLDRGAEAVPVIDECVQRAAGRIVAPRMLPRLLELRLRYFQKGGDAAGCRRTAEMWESLKRSDAGSLYNAACLRAVTAAVIRTTDQSAASSKQADAEADRAMTWLQQAVEAGYRNAAHLKQDRDLDVLRQRADFRKLVTELPVRPSEN